MSTHVQIDEGAEIHESVQIGSFTHIFANVEIEEGVTIGDHCVIGQPSALGKKLRIGAGSNIRSHTIIYDSCDFGQGMQTGHHVLIRAGTKAGDLFSVGSLSDIEGECEFGKGCRLHSYVNVGQGSKVGNYVWLYSFVTLTNDPLPPSDIEEPVILEDGVVVGLGSTVYPGSIMRKGSYSASGATIMGDIPAGTIVEGTQSTPAGHVSSLMHFKSGTRHPWMRHSKHWYPEDTHSELDQLAEDIVQSKWGKKVGNE